MRGMTLRNRAYWEAHGEPYRLCRPAKALQTRLEGYGYTVYDYPNEAHLAAIPPEDHDPFSATGYPVESAFGVGHAIDIMPPPAGSGLPTADQLGEQICLDRQAGVPEAMWVKYVNHTDAAGTCWHDKWQPSHVRTTSSDRGHAHVSAYSNLDNSPIGDTYDPVARWRARMGEDMSAQDYITGSRQVQDWQSPGVRDAAAKAKSNTLSDREILEYLLDDVRLSGTLASTVAAKLAGDPVFVDKLASAVAAKLPATDIEALKAAFADVVAGTTLVPNRQ